MSRPSNPLRTLLVLGRTSNLLTIWTNVAVGWFLSGGSWTAELAWLIFGMSLLYLAGMYLNDAFDVAWDTEHAPERPIPSGHISAATVWILGLFQMAAGICLLLFLTSAHSVFVVALVVSILLYNWLHKRWAGSVLIMGLCRAFVYLAAGSAVVSQTTAIEVPGPVYLVAFGVIVYIAGLTLAARSEHLASLGGLPFGRRLMLMFPVLFPLFSSRLAPSGDGTSLLNSALIAVGVIGIWAWLVIMAKALKERVPKGIAYAIAGIAFYDAAVVAFADWRAAIACLACFLVTLVAQKYIPAT